MVVAAAGTWPVRSRSGSTALSYGLPSDGFETDRRDNAGGFGAFMSKRRGTSLVVTRALSKSIQRSVLGEEELECIDYA